MGFVMRMVVEWKKVGIEIKFNKRVRALGVGLGVGVRRNMTILRQRYHKYRARIGRC